MNTHARFTTAARRSTEGGYVLLAVLVLSVLVASLSMGYARHATLAADNAHAVLGAQRAEHAADSGVVWARQSLLAGASGAVEMTLDEDSHVAIAIADVGDGRRRVSVAGAAGASTQMLDGLAETYARVGGSLPMLTNAARRAVEDHPAVLRISGVRSFNATTLNGLILLEDGATLTLQNVIVNGSIVSEPAVRGTWTEAERTTLLISGSLLVSPDAQLAGCAIVAPDASVTGLSSSAVQLEGTVVCQELSLSGWGAVHGQIATASPPLLSAGIDLPGAGRAPRGWPAALDTGAVGVSHLSFTRADVSNSERDAIADFEFPVEAAGSP